MPFTSALQQFVQAQQEIAALKERIRLLEAALLGDGVSSAGPHRGKDAP